MSGDGFGGEAPGRGDTLAVPFALGGLTAVRHGQSTANAAFEEAARTGATGLPVAGADADVPLSGPGRAQASALGVWLAASAPERRPEVVVCSPYLRARETWSIMAATAAERGRRPPPVLVDGRLRDREMGVFELHPPAAIARRAPGEAERRARSGAWAYRPPGGESLADVALRVGDFLDRLDRAAPGRQVLVVAHDSVVVALRYVIAGIGAPVPDGVAVPNASVSHWAGDGRRLRLVTWADTRHLTGGNAAL
ncbi:histidine phosphatase family protein [Yinghuangia sp. ASG 101]|uniref:histidine phosphatase family protein n=1 Tax=Yinghuangia sp. ASG 101 TaxID=2896848 RepID=UPI001E63F44B|nr:histidine phosphatase family protein [Yinghuangia sp. ASG 101]UGQ12182.1 histidine phosphatase family protein [Yinghuangia sp. ASG 101]